MKMKNFENTENRFVAEKERGVQFPNLVKKIGKIALAALHIAFYEGAKADIIKKPTKFEQAHKQMIESAREDKVEQIIICLKTDKQKGVCVPPRQIRRADTTEFYIRDANRIVNSRYDYFSGYNNVVIKTIEFSHTHPLNVAENIGDIKNIPPSSKDLLSFLHTIFNLKDLIINGTRITSSIYAPNGKFTFELDEDSFLLQEGVKEALFSFARYREVYSNLHDLITKKLLDEFAPEDDDFSQEEQKDKFHKLFDIYSRIIKGNGSDEIFDEKNTVLNLAISLGISIDKSKVKTFIDLREEIFALEKDGIRLNYRNAIEKMIVDIISIIYPKFILVDSATRAHIILAEEFFDSKTSKVYREIINKFVYAHKLNERVKRVINSYENWVSNYRKRKKDPENISEAMQEANEILKELGVTLSFEEYKEENKEKTDENANN